MRPLLTLIKGACLGALLAGLVIAMRPAQAQTPVPSLAPAAAVVTPPANSAARAVAVTPPRVATPYASAYGRRPQTRVYSVPAQGTSSGPHYLHYGYWPTRRPLFLAKPWLKHD